MNRKTIFTASDGLVFESEIACIKHEDEIKKIKMQKIQTVMCNLDDLIWKKYFPNQETDVSKRTLDAAHLWLKNDVIAILAYCDEIQADAADVFSFIEESEFGSEILEKYISKDKILREVSIRRDYVTAFEQVSNGKELSGAIGYVLGKKDLYKLAELHKTNQFRKKIEELLEDCNFHYEHAKFASGEYDEFLKPEDR